MHTHAPARQPRPLPHAVAHVPQWAPADVRSASHPLAGLPSQSPKPSWHAHPGVAPVHRWCAAQACPHVPQLRASVVTSAHAIPQRVSPAPQSAAHPRAVHAGVAPPHARPHAPQ